MEGRNAQNQPVTLVARGAATLYNGTSATLTLSPQMLPVAFSGTITLPEMPGWDGVNYQAVLSTYADPATALSTINFTPSSGTHSFQNVPVGDYVVTVCDAAHEELVPTAPESDARPRLAGVSHWSVPDPVAAGTDAAFDAAYDDIAGRVADLAPRLAHLSATAS